jgi:signal transduction histidine kinase
VRDTGIGFGPWDAQRLIEPFYTTKDHGMGIGLAISRAIIESRRGRLWAAASTYGPGALFAFSIPAYVESEAFVQASR